MEQSFELRSLEELLQRLQVLRRLVDPPHPEPPLHLREEVARIEEALLRRRQRRRGFRSRTRSRSRLPEQRLVEEPMRISRRARLGSGAPELREGVETHQPRHHARRPSVPVRVRVSSRRFRRRHRARVPRPQPAVEGEARRLPELPRVEHREGERGRRGGLRRSRRLRRGREALGSLRRGRGPGGGEPLRRVDALLAVEELEEAGHAAHLPLQLLVEAVLVGERREHHRRHFFRRAELSLSLSLVASAGACGGRVDRVLGERLLLFCLYRQNIYQGVYV
ncbi:protein LONGIFOLIA 1 [Iris pallida]|uniref:Protein LONGIFOLIA 1 n=1 Tax=Iris pallida TaxID=29817 RepID=A0AAX6FYY1_IRIPA|nr:protein LONGIFOLIA 1 [Iris pallida]